MGKRNKKNKYKVYSNRIVLAMFLGIFSYFYIIGVSASYAVKSESLRKDSRDAKTDLSVMQIDYLSKIQEISNSKRLADMGFVEPVGVAYTDKGQDLAYVISQE